MDGDKANPKAHTHQSGKGTEQGPAPIALTRRGASELATRSSTRQDDEAQSRAGSKHSHDTGTHAGPHAPRVKGRKKARAAPRQRGTISGQYVRGETPAPGIAKWTK